MNGSKTRRHILVDMVLLKDTIKKYKVILGSASPRRSFLLKGLDFEFTVETNGDIPEDYNPEINPEQVPVMLSQRKSRMFHRAIEKDELLITADTLVICNGKILGKPSNRDQAIAMLSDLSGNRHTVITGVTLRTSAKEASFSASTNVFFKELSSQEIEYYVDEYSPYDKAGSYGAQDWIGYTAIKSIEGSYFNVVGLPVEMLSEKLMGFVGDTDNISI
ncbi:MAG: Maf family nucleotide pyrophosphatase [Bacteroidales bacterium]|nr:Maf family nucleotide pyrophosphatase [Bacteroidales bacterium]